MTQHFIARKKLNKFRSGYLKINKKLNFLMQKIIFRLLKYFMIK
jgi:hypothetical protein